MNVCEVSFMLRPLYLRGKSPQYPLDRRLGSEEEKTSELRSSSL
jgi:hypothetical protein